MHTQQVQKSRWKELRSYLADVDYIALSISLWSLFWAFVALSWFPPFSILFAAFSGSLMTSALYKPVHESMKEAFSVAQDLVKEQHTALVKMNELLDMIVDKALMSNRKAQARQSAHRDLKNKKIKKAV